jgi:hypothetical protein
MLSKNFIFTALFFGIILCIISCLGNEQEKKHKQLYTILPTDSSSFSISLDGIESIKTPNFNLDGRWELMHQDSTQKTQSLYLTFEGRKIFSTLSSDFNSFHQKESTERADYQVFAMYDKCPDENGVYDKKGKFLIIGSGDEKLTCYEVISYESTKIVLYEVEKGSKLEFKKIN